MRAAAAALRRAGVSAALVDSAMGDGTGSAAGSAGPTGEAADGADGWSFAGFASQHLGVNPDTPSTAGGRTRSRIAEVALHGATPGAGGASSAAAAAAASDGTPLGSRLRGAGSGASAGAGSPAAAAAPTPQAGPKKSPSLAAAAAATSTASATSAAADANFSGARFGMPPAANNLDPLDLEAGAGAGGMPSAGASTAAEAAATCASSAVANRRGSRREPDSILDGLRRTWHRMASHLAPRKHDDAGKGAGCADVAGAVAGRVLHGSTRADQMRLAYLAVVHLWLLVLMFGGSGC